MEKLSLSEISVKLSWTVQEAALISNIGENKLRDLIRAGKLDHFKIGNRFNIPADAMRVFIEDSGKRKDQI